jgi:c-di-GMP-binding flagellar brake protein YcgR
MKQERRQAQRVTVRDGAVAFLGEVPGTILDISEKGISVHFVVFEHNPEPRCALDLFFAEDNFYLAGLDAELVSDLPAQGESDTSRTRARRLGLRFCDLTPKQKEELCGFIYRNTVAKA